MSKRLCAFFLVLWICTIGRFTSASQGDKPNMQTPVSVCQVLENLQQYDGKTVEIRGPWRGGDLWDNCAVQKASNERIADWKWPNAIGVLLPDGRRLPPLASPALSRAAYESARAIVEQIAKQRNTLPLATIVGRIEVRDLSDIFKPGTTVAWGRPASFHAFLIATSIRDISGDPIVPANPEPLGVCQVLTDRAKYQGKFVQVRGLFELNVLWEKCPSFQTEHYQWENVIDLVLPNDGLLTVDGPAHWTFSRDLYTSAVERALRINSIASTSAKDVKTLCGVDACDLSDDAPIAIVIGRFDTRDLELEGQRHGFGHLGSRPARLVIVDVKDLARNPKR
jgi:hypothetical protein